MMSSDTRPPASMTFFASRPSGVPAFTAARSMSPVEILRNAELLLDEVGLRTLPAPGGPNRISRMLPPSEWPAI